MLYGLLGLILGIGIGILSPLVIPLAIARYSAVGLFAIINAVVGAARADMQGTYDPAIFLSGLVLQLLLASGITYLGDRLGLDLALAVLVVFTFTIFQNAAKIRYVFLTRFLGRERVKTALEETK
ncbi:small basic family protein [Candidatus Berkelbacteria bacterium]|nr:small basic family protein [Candidatus Berkelbacteria bacterium]